jgi:hypothetical protein
MCILLKGCAFVTPYHNFFEGKECLQKYYFLIAFRKDCPQLFAKDMKWISEIRKSVSINIKDSNYPQFVENIGG